MRLLHWGQLLGLGYALTRCPGSVRREVGVAHVTTDEAQPPECVEMTRNKTLVWPLVRNVSFCARLLCTERERLGDQA